MGRDKSFLILEDRTLLERAVACLRDVTHPVYIASGEHTHECPGCTTVRDGGHAGPLGGIRAALQASPHVLCAVIAVDMPRADPALLGALIAAWKGGDAVVPISGRGPEPLHAVYAKSAVPIIEAALAAGEFAVRRVFENMRTEYVAADAAGAAPDFAENLNTPDDVTRWLDSQAAIPPPLA